MLQEMMYFSTSLAIARAVAPLVHDHTMVTVSLRQGRLLSGSA